MRRSLASVCLATSLFGCVEPEPGSTMMEPPKDEEIIDGGAIAIPRQCNAYDLEQAGIWCEQRQVAADRDPAELIVHTISVHFVGALDGEVHVVDAEVDHVDYYLRGDSSGGGGAEPLPAPLVAGPSHDGYVTWGEVHTEHRGDGPTTRSRVRVSGTLRVGADGHGELHLATSSDGDVILAPWEFGF